MVKPNYHDGSIVNLMSTIISARGGNANHNPLKILKPSEIKRSKNIVLIVIDGLGYNLLVKRGADSTMMKHLLGKMTSVFPSTTSAAITSYMTGLEPVEHALISWFTYLKEFGFISVPLRFAIRGGTSIKDEVVEHLFDSKSVFDKIKTQGIVVQPDIIVDSPYSSSHSGKAKRLKFKNLDGMVKAIKRAVNSNQKKKFIYSYWHMLDTLSHKHSPDGPEVAAELNRIDQSFSILLKSLKGTDTMVILSADHGQIKINKNHMIIVNDIRGFTDCLAMPLSGDSRVKFAYIRSGRKKQFLKIARTKLKNVCDIYKSEAFAKMGYFGNKKPHKRFLDRIGDYVLVAKGDHVILDFFPGQERKFDKGKHSGTSEDEMIIPLVVAKC